MLKLSKLLNGFLDKLVDSALFNFFVKFMLLLVIVGIIIKGLHWFATYDDTRIKAMREVEFQTEFTRRLNDCKLDCKGHKFLFTPPYGMSHCMCYE